MTKFLILLLAIATLLPARVVLYCNGHHAMYMKEPTKPGELAEIIPVGPCEGIPPGKPWVLEIVAMTVQGGLTPTTTLQPKNDGARPIPPHMQQTLLAASRTLSNPPKPDPSLRTSLQAEAVRAFSLAGFVPAVATRNLTGRSSTFSTGQVENCYFPPCTSQPEFPMRGSVTGLEPGTTIAIADLTGRNISAASIDPSGTFAIPAPSAPGKPPYKICILRPQAPAACGEAGVAAPSIQAPGMKEPMKVKSLSNIKKPAK